MTPAHNSTEHEQDTISGAPVMELEELEYKLEATPSYKPEPVPDMELEGVLSDIKRMMDIPEAEPEPASDITLEELLPDLPRITEPLPDSPEPSPEFPESVPESPELAPESPELKPEQIFELELLEKKPANLKKFLATFNVTKTHSVDAVVENICKYYDDHTYKNIVGLDKKAISETIDVFAKFLSLEYFKGQYDAGSREIGGGLLYMILLSHPSLKKWRDKIDFKFENFNPETKVLTAGSYNTGRKWRSFDVPPDNDSPYSAINLYVDNFQSDLFNSVTSAVIREIGMVNHRKSKRDKEYHAIRSDESIRREKSIAEQSRRDVKPIRRERKKREIYFPFANPTPQRLLSGVTSNYAFGSGVNHDTLGPKGGTGTQGGYYSVKAGPSSPEEYRIALEAYNKAKEANSKFKVIGGDDLQERNIKYESVLKHMVTKK